mmetsp:Transcript_6878/g.20260  ORF Transcript_6878/g.20260 Transcript_6878/m.20260 type:complete len:395 (-) Transcript_6878:1247-2431(-)
MVARSAVGLGRQVEAADLVQPQGFPAWMTTDQLGVEGVVRQVSRRARAALLVRDLPEARGVAAEHVPDVQVRLPLRGLGLLLHGHGSGRAPRGWSGVRRMAAVLRALAGGGPLAGVPLPLLRAGLQARVISPEGVCLEEALRHPRDELPGDLLAEVVEVLGVRVVLRHELVAGFPEVVGAGPEELQVREQLLLRLDGSGDGPHDLRLGPDVVPELHHVPAADRELAVRFRDAVRLEVDGTAIAHRALHDLRHVQLPLLLRGADEALALLPAAPVILLLLRDELRPHPLEVVLQPLVLEPLPVGLDGGTPLLLPLEESAAQPLRREDVLENLLGGALDARPLAELLHIVLDDLGSRILYRVLPADLDAHSNPLHGGVHHSPALPHLVDHHLRPLG